MARDTTGLVAPMTLDDGRQLQAVAEELLSVLEDIPDRLDPGPVIHGQHWWCAQRAVWLGYHLAAAMSLSRTFAYPSAFVVLRAALEHHVIDLLLFLGDRYRQVFHEVSSADWDQYQKERAEGEHWTHDIIGWQWRDGTLTVVRSGPHINGGPETLSIYYGFLEEYDPFTGPPADQRFLTTEFMEESDHERLAEKQRALYASALRWDRLRDNLRLNGLFSEKELAQLGVHYRFLSAFVHPVSEGYRLVYGYNMPATPPHYDHCASELVLLYVVTLATRELRAFRRMADRPPQVRLRNWKELEEVLRHAEGISAHLWFPGGSPHQFDKVEEANHRGLRNGRLVPVTSQERQRPEDIPEEEIRYYRNPLARLRRMHHSSRELTGFPYVSPWG